MLTGVAALLRRPFCRFVSLRLFHGCVSAESRTVRLSFFVCELVFCEAVNCGIFACFNLNVCIDRRLFLRVPWLFYCFRALPRLRFGHGFFCLVSCNVFL